MSKKVPQRWPEKLLREFAEKFQQALREELPKRIAERLAGVEDPDEVEAIMQEEIDRICDEWQAKGIQALGDMTIEVPDGEGDDDEG